MAPASNYAEAVIPAPAFKRAFTALLATLAVAAAAGLAAPGGAAAAQLKVGVGQADITPPTGYYMMGWVRSDGLISGQHTRLWARTAVIQRGKQKFALVSEDLNGIPGGMVIDAAKLLRKRGFSPQNIIVSASHTHAAPTGFYNFDTFNTVFMTLDSPTDFQLTGGFDPTLYQFMVRQLAKSIRRADKDLAPGKVGWGFTRIKHLTENRSLEAHLADHGIHEPYGTGSVDQDPQGRLHTIDDEVNVLRLDKTIGGRDIPVGVWATFADHGTVNGFQFTYYNEDHHGAATLLTSKKIRKAGNVPRDQDVVTVYGNTDEGDQSAGLHQRGPAYAEYVGRVESQAFMRGWRQAGKRMSGSLELGHSWTQMCFCGQQTSAGPTDDQAKFGLPQLTGSEEGRGPLFDVTHNPFEGRTQPSVDPEQGHKIVTLTVGIAKAAPLAAVRIGDRLIVTVPGEMTEEMGRRLRASVLEETRDAGIRRVVISGLANEYMDYFTTPEEYDAQHYEGGSTVYGRNSSVALQDGIDALAASMAAGEPPPEPYETDLTNGITPDGSKFPTGADSASVVSEPAPKSHRLEHPAFSWQGGLRGYDRPLDRAFVTVQRRAGAKHWRTVDSDLGLRILWRVDEKGVYTAEWEPPLTARRGTYRFSIHARGYRIASRGFRLFASNALVPKPTEAPDGRFAVLLHYPAAQAHEDVNDPAPDQGADLTYRPDHARSGRITFTVDGRSRTVRAGPGGRFEIPAGAGDRISIAAAAARDGNGNRNGRAFSFSP